MKQIECRFRSLWREVRGYQTPEIQPPEQGRYWDPYGGVHDDGGECLQDPNKLDVPGLKDALRWLHEESRRRDRVEQAYPTACLKRKKDLSDPASPMVGWWWHKAYDARPESPRELSDRMNGEAFRREKLNDPAYLAECKKQIEAAESGDSRTAEEIARAERQERFKLVVRDIETRCNAEAKEVLLAAQKDSDAGTMTPESYAAASTKLVAIRERYRASVEAARIENRTNNDRFVPFYG